jgi:hypothetical protein
MRTILATTIGAATILCCGMAARQAEATVPMAVPPTAVILPIESVTNVCGNNGCVRIQTQRLVKHQKAGNVVPRHN